MKQYQLIAAWTSFFAVCLPTLVASRSCYFCPGWETKCGTPDRIQRCADNENYCRTYVSGFDEDLWMVKSCARSCNPSPLTECDPEKKACKFCCTGDKCNEKDWKLSELKRQQNEFGASTTPSPVPRTRPTDSGQSSENIKSTSRSMEDKTQSSGTTGKDKKEASYKEGTSDDGNKAGNIGLPMLLNILLTSTSLFCARVLLA